jgi:hypothetical protein
MINWNFEKRTQIQNLRYLLLLKEEEYGSIGRMGIFRGISSQINKLEDSMAIKEGSVTNRRGLFSKVRRITKEIESIKGLGVNF